MEILNVNVLPVCQPLLSGLASKLMLLQSVWKSYTQYT